MLTIIFWAVGALAVFFLTVMAIDCNRFTIRKYNCSSKKLEKDMKIVLLSDMHNKSFGEDNRKLVRAIDQVCPDLILIAGDMYTAAKGQGAKKAQKLMEALADKYPVYYGNGNHEQKTALYPEEYENVYQIFVKELEKMGVRHLVNKKASLTSSRITIYGLELEREYYRKFKKKKMDKGYLEKLLGRPDPLDYNIMIAHNPDYFEDYAAWGADLVVSGHIHGGLMKLPFLGGVISPTMRLFPKYDGGLFEAGSSRLVLSRGLGTHTLPIRIFNPGELVVIRLWRNPDKGFDC